MPVLRILTGAGKGAVFELEDRLTIGRDDTETIQIMDKGASRSHAEVVRLGEMFFVKDLESRNGTYINDERIEDELLRDGDRIRIGKTVMVFEDKDSPSRIFQPPSVKFQQEENLTRTIEFRLDDLVVDEKGDLDEATAAHSQGGSKHLGVLYKVSKKLGTGKDPVRMMEQVMEIVIDAVGGEFGFVFTCDEGDRELSPLVMFQAKTSDFAGESPTVSRSIIKRAYKDKRPIMTEDATRDTRFRGEESVVMKQVRSVICVPLTTRDGTAGVMYIAGGMLGEPFTADDFELITTIGIQAGMALEGIRATEKHRETFISAIRMLMSAIELRDPLLTVGSERISSYSVAIGEVLGLPTADVYTLKVASLLHNISAIAMSQADVERIKNPECEEDRMECVHASIVDKLFAGMKGLEQILPAIKYSYERHDGSGFPDGLEGEQIPMNARIISVAKYLDGQLWSGRRRSERDVEEVLEEINKLGQNGTFDPKVTRALTISFRRGTLKNVGEEFKQD